MDKAKIQMVRFINQTTLVTVSTESVTIWTITKSSMKGATLTGRVIDNLSAGFTSVALSKDGLIYTGASDGKVYIWNIISSKNPAPIDAHDKMISTLNIV